MQPLSETERANLDNACNHPVHIHKVPGDKGTGKLKLQHNDLTLLQDADEMLNDKSTEAMFQRLAPPSPTPTLSALSGGSVCLG